MVELTLEELKKFNGEDGTPAYIAYEGKIYDMSGYAAWAGGTHHGKARAGIDVTDIFKNEAPHKEAIFDVKAIPQVGILKD